MRRPVLVLATAVLLGGPTVLAFYAGGYFDGPRAAAAAVAWAVVFALAVAGPAPLPRSAPGWAALAGLAGLAAWSAISVLWAPLTGVAVDNVQRLLLYVAALLAAIGLLRDRRAARAAEPALALGALVAIGYGLSERLLPALVDPEGGLGAGGRLQQPITYWNAESLLAAIGLVLCIRVAGDHSRRPPLRIAAAAACVPLGVGVYLCYSRGGIAVAVLGLIVLLAATPTWTQLRAAVVGVLGAVVASVGAAALPSVTSLQGSSATQQREGAIMLAILIVVTVAVALATARLTSAERLGRARLGRLRHAQRLPALAAVAVFLCVAGLVAGGLGENAGRSESGLPSPKRLVSVNSLRYEYWRVGLEAFADRPLLGEGAGGFRVVWYKEREVNRGVSEVHSLVLEQAVELGIPGLALFCLLVGGVAVAGRRALARAAPLAPGACTVCTMWLLHASIDWDWQLPAVTLPAIVLAGGLLVASEGPSGRLPGRPRPAAQAEPVPPVPAGTAEVPSGVSLRLR